MEKIQDKIDSSDQLDVDVEVFKRLKNNRVNRKGKKILKDLEIQKDIQKINSVSDKSGNIDNKFSKSLDIQWESYEFPIRKIFERKSIEKKTSEVFVLEDDIQNIEQTIHKKFQLFNTISKQEKHKLQPQREELFPKKIFEQSELTLPSLSILNSSSSTSGSQFKSVSQIFFEKTMKISKIDSKLISKFKDDDFQFIELLGEGSFGKVEKHLLKTFSQEVAKKSYFNKDNIDEYNTEVYFLNNFQDETIPKLVYFNRDNLSIYIELGMFTLENYFKFLRKKNMQIKDEIAHWILENLLALNYNFYQLKIHHSDIKPDKNQLPCLKFIDFGAASNHPEDYWDQYTPPFVSPELFIIYEKSQSLTREQIFYAECYASCRSVQFLMLATSQSFKKQFDIENISNFLEDSKIQTKYISTLPLMKSLLQMKDKSIDSKICQQLLQNYKLKVDQQSFKEKLVENFEEVYQFINQS